MKKFIIESEFWDLFPKAKIGVIVFNGIDNSIKEKEMYAGPNDEDFNIRGIGERADIHVENTLPLDEYVALVYRKLGLE